MRIAFFIPVLLAFLLCQEIQAQQSFSFCKDTTRIPDTFINCGRDYDPVCGCDNVTYRNECAAEIWGGLFNGSWSSGTICGNFDIDFFPTAVTYFLGQFSIFFKVPGSATGYIYDAFGKLKNLQFYHSGSSNHVETRELPVQNLDLGIYVLFVVMNGEPKYIKFAKVTQFDR
ncbi:MAG: hypothetical protein DWQ44_07865 [Bacteroidetes bacterium]|nr:MAG: hypothetical protein DWQ44_07865 [Bacteroidota bacterium]REK47678.1 MAG: hypothetical protein DWQ48_11900 [Bacteroidota bacterium]